MRGHSKARAKRGEGGGNNRDAVTPPSRTHSRPRTGVASKANTVHKQAYVRVGVLATKALGEHGVLEGGGGGATAARVRVRCTVQQLLLRPVQAAPRSQGDSLRPPHKHREASVRILNHVHPSDGLK
jgi:hypothetical protein